MGQPHQITKPLRVLLIDDDLDFAEVIGDLIHSWGHEVARVSSGEAALSLLTRAPPDLVISDLVLPDISGFEVAMKSRELRVAGQTRFVMLSGYCTDSLRKRAQLAGYCHYMVKPVLPEVLRGVIEREPLTLCEPRIKTFKGRQVITFDSDQVVDVDRYWLT